MTFELNDLIVPYSKGGVPIINLDKKLHRFLTILLYVVFATGYLLIYFGNTSGALMPLSLFTLIVALSTLSHLRYYRYDSVNNKAKIFIILNMLLLFIFLYFDHSDFRQLFLLVLIGDCIFAFPRSFSIPYVICTYSTYYPYMFFAYNQRDGWNYSFIFVDDLVISVFCIIILYLVKSQIKVNVKYNALLLKQDGAYSQLEKYATKIEDLAIVEERNRIALILHNSIGHSLTSIMLSLQAEKMELIHQHKIDKSAFQTVEKIIQDAMTLLRRTIENADDFTQLMAFDEIMDCFIREASNNTRVNISYTPQNTDFIQNSQKSVILNIVTEAITNAAKHSGCDYIQVTISGAIEGITLTINDNGCGYDTIDYGFGITKTIQLVERLNGHYEITSDKGCHISVFLPCEEVNEDV